MDLALLQPERYIVIGDDARKPLGDSDHLNSVLFFFRHDDTPLHKSCNPLFSPFPATGTSFLQALRLQDKIRRTLQLY